MLPDRVSNPGPRLRYAARRFSNAFAYFRLNRMSRSRKVLWSSGISRMLTFSNYGPLKRSADLWLTEFESHRRRNSSYRKRAPTHAEFHYRFNNMHILSDIS